MQSVDPQEQIVQADVLQSDLGGLVEKIQQAQEKGAVKRIIASLPSQGATVELNGLKFKVVYVNNGRGDVHLKIINPEETE